MKKTLRKLWRNKYSKMFAYLFLKVFFLFIHFCTFNKNDYLIKYTKKALHKLGYTNGAPYTAERCAKLCTGIIANLEHSKKTMLKEHSFYIKFFFLL